MEFDDETVGVRETIYVGPNNRQAALEEIATQALLVELFHAKQAEVFENVVFEGKRRYYVEDLTVRDYCLENTTPYQLDILGHVIETSTWGILLCKTSELLLDLFPEYHAKILSFRCPWSKQAMFILEQKTNCKLLKGGLFINCNHTALHACWFLQDLLDFFGINKSSINFLIRRPSGAEPKKVKEYIEKRFKRNFAEFLQTTHKKTEEYVGKVISIIEKHLNRILSFVSKSYTNFFLFDDNATLSNYTKKTREIIASNINFDTKTKITLNKCLDFLIQYYKSI